MKSADADPKGNYTELEELLGEAFADRLEAFRAEMETACLGVVRRAMARASGKVFGPDGQKPTTTAAEQSPAGA